MRFFFFVFLAILLLFQSLVFCDELENFMADSSSTESECVELVTSAEQPYVYHKTHIPLVMRKGYWACAKEIITLAQKGGSDVRNIFDMESRAVMKEIATLKTTVEKSLPIASITPAFQWAQSPNEVFINVKFAHKLDAPATLNVESKNVTLSGNLLYLQATDGRKNFVLEMELLREINVEQSTWSMASVGRMVFTLKKDEAPSKWSRLLLSKTRKPQNMHSWWELAEKHREELDKLDEDGSDEDDDGITTKTKPKKAAAKKAAAAKEGAESTEESTEADSKETPEEAAKRQQKETIENELKTKIKELEDETRQRKKEVETKAKADKKAIDAEFKAKKAELEAASKAAVEALDPPKSLASLASEL